MDHEQGRSVWKRLYEWTRRHAWLFETVIKVIAWVVIAMHGR
ncbi:hypothetical protein [Actinomadura terrae]|nr:hypothetical protein [Actinomadura terrae]